MNFSFIHAADLHLDSPLLGLSRKSQEYAERVDRASRQAFDNLIALAIEERCRFVLLAGDIFDGQWRDYATGMFFASRMRHLNDAGIQVFMILGNHDAENRFASRLELSTNVRLLSSSKSESVVMPDVGVVVHGRSFSQRDVLENLALTYPAPVAGHFNIGLLHTSCTGRDLHASYAPCSVEQLVNAGYDYWALGHVHAREVLYTSPHVIFPGNLQGRNPRETGSKGATLVKVEDGKIVEATHRELDVVRWANEIVDVSESNDLNEVHNRVRAKLEQLYAEGAGRALAIRLRLAGETGIHDALVVGELTLRDEVETIAASVGENLWIERLELRTSPHKKSGVVDPTISGKMREAVESIGHGPDLAKRIDERLSEVRPKMPAGARIDELYAEIRANTPKRAVELVQALLQHGSG